MSAPMIKGAVYAGILAVATSFAGVASAADLGDYGPGPVMPPVVQGPYPGPAPYYSSYPRPPAPIENDEDCRVIHERQIDSYGRPIVRRLRVCDEGVVERYSQRGPYPRRGYERPDYDGPEYDRSDYRRGPRDNWDYPGNRY